MPAKRRAARLRRKDLLPAALTPILGRARELAETSQRLAETRLLTLTGAGGSGKTRLALELARQSPRAVWVDLAPLSDPDLIAPQILTSLQIEGDDVTGAIAESLGEGRLLIVLDNCEHLVDRCAQITEEILRAVPGVTILTTTREPLGIAGEQTWLVPPLATDDAVQLFIERARAVDASFSAEDVATIGQICARLDGIPLAIELAAARVRVLSVSQIAERLDDAFQLLTSGSRTLPRHRTIREAIDWSFRLLGDDEQTLLRRLAVFAGTFSLDAAEAICGPSPLDVLSTLSALVEKSLVICDRSAAETRYRLLDTVRQFAAEKLGQAGEHEDFRERHTRHFFDLAVALEPRVFTGAADAAAVARLDRESDNLHAALDSLASTPTREGRLIYSLHWYWFARGLFFEARRRANAALARGGEPDPLALVAAADAAAWQGDFRALPALVHDAVAKLRGSEEHRALSLALTLRGTSLAFAEEDPAGAQAAFREAELVANGHPGAMAFALYWSGLAAQRNGDWDSARRIFTECHRIGETAGHRPAIGHSLTALGHVALHDGAVDEAVRCFATALAIHSATGDRWGLTHVVEGIGITLLITGDAEPGTRLLAAATAAWIRLGARPGRDESFEVETRERIREAVGDERLRVVLASGAALAYDDMVALAREQTARLSETSTPRRARIQIRALGALEIRRDGVVVDSTAAARARELLLFLLLQHRPMTKEAIGLALWPDADPAKLRNNFHVTIHRLRKLLGGTEWVVTTGETYAIDRGPIELDAETFEREATSALRGAERNPEDAERLAKAVELYGGEFLAGSAAGDWLLEVRDRLRDLNASALATLGRIRMREGDFAGAVAFYERMLALDPVDEQAGRNLMTCLARSGATEEASRVYRRLTDALRREVDAPPDPATIRLHARIVAGEV
jgi:predicted ATPase/DNA-binding SARP family transcriptional activator